MRYVSDLHVGKVNPKHFAFGLDVEAKKYDLSEFLKDHVVDASDVAGILAQVEPPYPHRLTCSIIGPGAAQNGFSMGLQQDYAGIPLKSLYLVRLGSFHWGTNSDRSTPL